MIGYIRPDGFAAIPHPARRPDGGRVRQSLSSQKKLPISSGIYRLADGENLYLIIL